MDPPYGADHHDSTAECLTLANDRHDGLSYLHEISFKAANAAFQRDATLCVAHLAGPHSQIFAAVFQHAGWHLHHTLIWVKDAFLLGHSDYHYRQGSILYRWKGSKHPWYGSRGQQSVFEVTRVRLASKQAKSDRRYTIKEGEC